MRLQRVWYAGFIGKRLLGNLSVSNSIGLNIKDLSLASLINIQLNYLQSGSI